MKDNFNRLLQDFNSLAKKTFNRYQRLASGDYKYNFSAVKLLVKFSHNHKFMEITHFSEFGKLSTHECLIPSNKMDFLSKIELTRLFAEKEFNHSSS